MQLKYLLIAFVGLLTACTNSNNPQNENGADSTASANSSNQAQSSGNWEKLVMHKIRDQKGTIIAEMPFPSGWTILERRTKDDPSITGPNGVKIVDFPAQSFLYSTDPQMQQLYYQSGQPMRAMPGIEQIIEQDIKPWAVTKGLQFVRQYEIPEVAKIDKWYSDQLYKAMPTQTEFAAIGTEWKSADDKPYFLLIHLNVSTGGDLQSWYYNCSGLEADEKHFEAARKQYIFSLANTYYPIEPIMEYNQREAEKVGKSWAAHNQRMAQNQANFEASQRAFISKSNAINDAIMSNNGSSGTSDKSHQQFIDAITEQTNVSDADGQQYKVNSGSNQYWMNTNGEYIGTNKTDYNPNADERLNQENWKKLKEGNE